MKTPTSTTHLPSTTKTKNQLSIHHAWGLAHTYYPSSVEVYEVADELMKAGWTVSIRIG